MARLAAFVRLTPAERRVALWATVLLPACALALQVVGYGRCQGWLARLTREPRAEPSPESLSRARAVAGIVGAVARRGIPQVACLPRSQVLWFLLRRQGIASVIRIGVRRPGAALEGHAWVEVCGRPLEDLPDGHERFAAMQPARRPARK